jgi:hypothetical protein
MTSVLTRLFRIAEASGDVLTEAAESQPGVGLALL